MDEERRRGERGGGGRVRGDRWRGRSPEETERRSREPVGRGGSRKASPPFPTNREKNFGPVRGKSEFPLRFLAGKITGAPRRAEVSAAPSLALHLLGLGPVRSPEKSPKQGYPVLASLFRILPPPPAAGWSGSMVLGVGRVYVRVGEGFLGCVCDEGGWIRGLLPRDPILSSSSPRRLATGGDDGSWVPSGGGRATVMVAARIHAGLPWMMGEGEGRKERCRFLEKKRKSLFSSSLGRSPSPAAATMAAGDGSASDVVGLGKERAQPPWLLPLDQKELREGDVFPTMKREESSLYVGLFTGTGHHRRRGSGHGWRRRRPVVQGGSRATPTALDLEGLRCLGTW